MTDDFQGFPRDAAAFLAELTKNNDRDWFQRQKGRYAESVQEPARALVRALGEWFAGFAPHVVADDRKVGGSLMRINRDVRFSKDKRPYDPRVAAQFFHELGKKASAPGYYVHIGPEGVTFGAGIWRPETPALASIREKIVAKPDDWAAVRDDKAFRKAFPEIGGESLKRPPRGFDADHPHVEDLKRKDLANFGKMALSTIHRKDFADKLAAKYEAGVDYCRFLAKAVGVKF